mmetsp:Transcript_77775/g.251992  ORF Transcript_77775/g.251992 Transcript_77775/m.251992 type:complete len:429 (+) Transcript_77775:414-1700(+)
MPCASGVHPSGLAGRVHLIHASAIGKQLLADVAVAALCCQHQRAHALGLQRRIHVRLALAEQRDAAAAAMVRGDMQHHRASSPSREVRVHHAELQKHVHDRRVARARGQGCDAVAVDVGTDRGLMLQQQRGDFDVSPLARKHDCGPQQDIHRAVAGAHVQQALADPRVPVVRGDVQRGDPLHLQGLEQMPAGAVEDSLRVAVHVLVVQILPDVHRIEAFPDAGVDVSTGVDQHLADLCQILARGVQQRRRAAALIGIEGRRSADEQAHRLPMSGQACQAERSEPQRISRGGNVCLVLDQDLGGLHMALRRANVQRLQANGRCIRIWICVCLQRPLDAAWVTGHSCIEEVLRIQFLPRLGLAPFAHRRFRASFAHRLRPCRWWSLFHSAQRHDIVVVDSTCLAHMHRRRAGEDPCEDRVRQEKWKKRDD